MMENLGFSLLEIITNNPKELTVNFGGPKGTRIREKYMQLKHELHATDGSAHVTKKVVPLFPEITETTDFYTFEHPEGLLFATQFTQPALTLVEKACFADMQAKGLVPSENIYYAGHR